MKLKILFPVFVACFMFSAFNTKANLKNDLANAEEAFQKGFLTRAQYEQFKKERDVNLLEKPYGDGPLLAVYQQTVLKLYSDAAEPYGLANEVNKSDALILAMRMTGREKEILAGNFEHPFTDVPAGADKYVGYAYQKGYLPKNDAKKFNSTEMISYNEYLYYILSILGYREGSDFTIDKINDFAKEKGFPLAPYGGTKFIKAKIVEINSALLSRSLKGKTILFKHYLTENNLLPTDALDFLYNQKYNTYFYAVKDNFNKVIWKYYNKYDFIYHLDCRNGPAPLHQSLTFPSKGVELEYAGYINIVDNGLGEQFYYQLLDDILTDLEVNQQKRNKIISEVKSKGKYQHIDYYTRIIEVSKKKNSYNLDLYLPTK